MEQKKQRSRSYPAYDLRGCVDWAGAVRAKLGSGRCDRESVAQATGSVGITGTSQRKLAALQYFGLMKRDSDGYYVLTPLSERILRPTEEHEKAEALLEAFMQPELFRELIERFRPDGRVPAMLPSILVRYHRIQDQVAEAVAQVFLDSGRYAGALGEDGRITFSTEAPGRAGADADGGEGEDSVKGKPPPPKPDLGTSVQTEEQCFAFALPGGRMARLTVPRDLTQNDVRLIKKQVEFLELQAEIAVVEPTEPPEQEES